MALSYEKRDNTDEIIAYDRTCNKNIYYSPDVSSQITKAVGHFQIAQPLYGVEFITGKMGCGKSYYIKDYIAQYHKINQDNKIFLFSYKQTDPAFEKYNNIIDRVKLEENDDFFDNFKIQSFHDSLVIFDDALMTGNKKVVDCLLKYISMGRQYNIIVIVTMHSVKMYGGNQKLIGNLFLQANRIVVYPKFSLRSNLNDLFKKFGFRGEQLRKLVNFDNNSRYVIYDVYRQMLITLNKIEILDL